MARNAFSRFLFSCPLAVILALCYPPHSAAQSNPPLDSLRNLPNEQAEICVLGTFHFKDAGRDTYKPKFDIDIMSAERQQEIDDILDKLEAFGPTKVAVEVDRERQGWLDSVYTLYLQGKKEITSNEIYQLGFKLGKRLGHQRLYAVDADAQSLYTNHLTDEQWEAKRDSTTTYGLPGDVWNDRLMRLYARDDSVKQYHTIRETFLYINSPERLTAGHGHYLIGSFQRGTDSEYYGPDSAIGWWVRNLRIFQNLIRITESPDDRLLLIIGAGHAPILDHSIDASPEYRLVPVGEVLGK
jgi:hypothetical protein